MTSGRPGGVGKRMIDVVGAAVGLALATPVLLVAAGLCRLRQGSPVLHRDLRAGWQGRPFVLLKLRTMSDERDSGGVLLPDDARLTRLGRALRRSSIDELPQLWHVLRGEMSLVGPRPLPIAYLSRYRGEEARRHDVLPGLTGWAQVHGRNALDWDERLALDVWYVDHRSTRLDLRILARTLSQVVRREGINQDGVATMTELRPGSDAG